MQLMKYVNDNKHKILFTAGDQSHNLGELMVICDVLNACCEYSMQMQ